MRSGYPPPNWRIWIAQHSTIMWKNAYFRTTVTLGFTNAEGAPVPLNNSLAKNTQALTMGIGGLLIQAISTAVPGLEFKVPPERNHIMRQLWPYASEICWPPIVNLSLADIDLMALEFDRILDSMPWTKSTP